MKFDKTSWVCVPPVVVDHRYVLAKCGSKMLVCVGVNPSTAIPNNLDKTLKRVDRIVQSCGYDGWVMLNLYPQKSTDPNRLDSKARAHWEALNRRVFEKVVHQLEMRQKTIDVWAAWGNLIDDHAYLKKSALALFSLCRKYRVTWKQAGNLTDKGNPRHPSRLKKGVKLEPFDVSSYEMELKSR